MGSMFFAKTAYMCINDLVFLKTMEQEILDEHQRLESIYEEQVIAISKK